MTPYDLNNIQQWWADMLAHYQSRGTTVWLLLEPRRKTMSEIELNEIRMLIQATALGGVASLPVGLLERLLDIAIRAAAQVEKLREQNEELQAMVDDLRMEIQIMHEREEDW